MLLEHEFTVPIPASEAWPVLLDIERIVSCIPGATLTAVTGRDFEGRLRVRAGSITVTYLGTAGFAELDEQDHRAVITAAGRQARGTGTVNATITTRLHDSEGGARVTVTTDLTVTGRLESAGHGALVGVGTRLLARFAVRLAELLVDQDVDHDATRVVESAAEPTEAPERPAAPEPATGAGRPDRSGRPGGPGRATSPVAVFAHSAGNRPEPSGAPALRWAARSLATLVLVALLVRRRRRRRDRR